MTTDNGSGLSDRDRLADLLHGLHQQAERMISDFKAADPATIDLVGRVESLPGVVLDVLLAMKEQLPDVSRAALDEWQEKTERRRRGLLMYQESSYAQALREREARERPLERQRREWQDQQTELQQQMRAWQDNPLLREMREWQEHFSFSCGASVSGPRSAS
ncbi:hypothetical protein GCM10027421_33990 [Microbacterium shaanxiense]